jgi:hypothetical protein
MVLNSYTLHFQNKDCLTVTAAGTYSYRFALSQQYNLYLVQVDARSQNRTVLHPSGVSNAIFARSMDVCSRFLFHYIMAEPCDGLITHPAGPFV